MSKRTAGPWVVDAHTVGRYKGVNVETVLGDRIASAGHSPFTLEEKQANARLIAAAPELLEACKAALVCIADDPQFWAEEEILRRVIAKAEGSTCG